jgi:ribosomal protein L21E
MLSKIRYLFSIYKEKKGLNTLSKALIKHVEYKNGYFVELGANDGISQSNTLYLEKYLGWRGVLVEPDVNNYIKCLKNKGLPVFSSKMLLYSSSEVPVLGVGVETLAGRL